MASHKKRGLKELVLGSQTQKVLAHTRIPVLVSAVESNAQSVEMNRAVGIIQGEHRSVAAVVGGLRHVVRKARDTAVPADLRLLRAMVRYFHVFRQLSHHAKEEDQLFVRLRACLPESAPMLSDLQKQHHGLADLLHALETALGEYQTSQDRDCLDQLALAVDHYAKRQWEHMRVEEKTLLLRCREHFTSEDWKQIAQAFEQNRRPRFDHDRDTGFEVLFSTIMKMCETFEKAAGEQSN